MMTRAEHLDWAKKRALEYLDAGDIRNAYGSMISDLRKHPELEDHLAIELSLMLLLGGHLSTDFQMRNWIEGFN